MRRALISAFVYVCIAVWVGWPTIHGLGVVVPGAEGTKVWESYWIFHHVLQNVMEGQSLFATQSLNFPSGGRVLAPDMFGAVLVLPVTYFFDVSTAMSLLVVFQLAFSGWVMHMFAADYLKRCVHIEASSWGPWLSGIALLCSSLMMSHVHNGSTEALSMGWTVLAVWLGWRASMQTSIRRAIVAGCFLALATLTHVYGGLVAFVFVLAVCLNRRSEDAVFSFSSYGTTLVVGFLLSLPILFSLSQGGDAATDLVNVNTTEQVRELTRSTGSADPLTYLRPGRYFSPNLANDGLGAGGALHVHYLGLTGIGLTVWVLVTAYRREYAFVVVGGVLCLFLSFGPVWIMDGRPVLFSGDLAVPMPFFLLESIPGISSMSAPWRLASGPTMMVALMVGVAAAQSRARMALFILVALLFDTHFLSPIADRSRQSEVRIASSIRELSRAPDGAVINYPLTESNAYLLEQTVHGKPVVGTLRSVSNARGNRLWRRIRSAAKQKPDTFHSAVSSTAKRLGIRYLVIHTDPNAEPDVYTAAVRKIETLFPTPEWGQGQTRVVPLW